LISDCSVEGENNDELICETTEVEILPSIDFCKFIFIVFHVAIFSNNLHCKPISNGQWRSIGHPYTPAIDTLKVPNLVKFLDERREVGPAAYAVSVCHCV